MSREICRLGIAGAGTMGAGIAQLVNEAHFAVAAGVGNRDDTDLAMRSGFNGPRGPFESRRC